MLSVYFQNAVFLNSARAIFLLIFPSFQVYNELKEYPEELNQKMVEKFVHHGLRPDGVLILRMIAENAGHVMATGLTGAMWEQFLEQEQKHQEKSAVQQQQKRPLPRSLDPVKGLHSRVSPTAPPKRPLSMDMADPGFEEKLVDELDRSDEDKALLQQEQTV